VDSLLKQLHVSDFAAFVLSPDDTVRIRRIDYSTARDNLFYEAGLATGIFGKDRCFLIVAEDDPKFHIPSDLNGITLALYNTATSLIDAQMALTDACAKIREAIDQSLWNNIKIETTFKLKRDTTPGITFKLKLFFYMTNEERNPVTIELGRSYFNSLSVDPVHKIYGSKRYFQPLFFIEKLSDKSEIFNYTHTFSPHQTKFGWFPIDPKYSDTEINKMIYSDQVGSLFYKASLDKDHPIVISHTILF